VHPNRSDIEDAKVSDENDHCEPEAATQGFGVPPSQEQGFQPKNEMKSQRLGVVQAKMET